MHEEQLNNQQINQETLNKIYQILQDNQKKEIEKEKKQQELDKKQLEKDKKEHDHKLNQEQFYLDYVESCKEFHNKSLEYQSSVLKDSQAMQQLLQVNIVCSGLLFGLVLIFMVSSFFNFKK